MSSDDTFEDLTMHPPDKVSIPTLAPYPLSLSILVSLRYFRQASQSISAREQPEIFALSFSPIEVSTRMHGDISGRQKGQMAPDIPAG
jgi:hypothetical protein